jgi:hypothetical protein
MASDLNWSKCVLAIARDDKVLAACETIDGVDDLPTAQEAVAHLNGMQAAAKEYVGLREWYVEHACAEQILQTIDLYLRGEA